MISFDPCRDIPLIKSILTRPEIYGSLHDDYGPPADEWEPVDMPEYVSYVLIREDGEILGMAIVNKHSEVQLEIHNAILPHVGWKKRIQVGRQFLEWLWAAGRKRVIGKALASNRYAIKYNQFMGMEIIGVNKKAFMKNGVLRDEVWLGISAPEGVV